MKTKVAGHVAKKNLPKDILSDETIRLTGERTSTEYPERLRRVTAHIFIDGKWRDMVFLTNKFTWLATTIAAFYKARWKVELLF